MPNAAPKNDYSPPTAAFVGESTAHAAYGPIPADQVQRAHSYKPRGEYKPTSTAFERETTASRAYKAWPVRSLEQPAWAKPSAYTGPSAAFTKTSSYQVRLDAKHIQVHVSGVQCTSMFTDRYFKTTLIIRPANLVTKYGFCILMII